MLSETEEHNQWQGNKLTIKKPIRKDNVFFQDVFFLRKTSAWIC